MTILDASAILGLLLGEDRAGPVVGHLSDAAISAVNLAEVVGKLDDVAMPAHVAADLMHRLNLRVVEFDEEQALIAGGLKRETAHLGLSLGDRACLATGIAAGDRIVTLDRAWARLDIAVPILVLG